MRWLGQLIGAGVGGGAHTRLPPAGVSEGWASAVGQEAVVGMGLRQGQTVELG